MPLLNILNQPLAFNSRRPVDSCVGDDQYKQLYQQGDVIMAQFRQTPCNDDITCDGDVNEIESSSLVANGGFSSGASWTTGTGWSIGSGVASWSGGVHGTLDQSLLITEGRTYRVEFTVNTLDDGDMYVSLGHNRFVISAAGGYQIYMIAGTDALIRFGPQNDASVTTTAIEIDNVAVYDVAVCWQFPTIETEHVTNGDLTLNANGWTLGGGWAWNAGGFLRRTPTISSAVTQNVALDHRTGYIFEVTVSNMNNGTLTVSYGGENIVVITINGTYTVPFSAKTTVSTVLSLLGNGPFDGDVDDVKIIRNINGWSATGDGACHEVPRSAILQNINTAILDDTVYEMEFEILNSTAGLVIPYIGGIAGSAQAGNGTYTQWITTASLGDSTFHFLPSAPFDGCVKVNSIKALKNDYVFELYEDDGDTLTLIADVSAHASYVDNYVTLNIPPEAIDTGSEIMELDFGCYRICVFDQCEIQYQEIIGDGEFNNPLIAWPSPSGFWLPIAYTSVGTVDVIASRLEMDNILGVSITAFILSNYKDGYPALNNPAQIPSGANNYRVTFTIVQNDDTANTKVGVLLGGSQGTLMSNPTVGTHTFIMNNINPDGFSPPRHWFALYVQYLNNATGVIIIDNVSVKRVEPFDATYCSQPFKYGAFAQNTILFQSDNETFAFGFKFNDTGFKLEQRIRVLSINPVYPEDTDDYIYSDGTQARNFSQTNKFWQVVTDRLPHWVHDCLRIQRLSKTFSMGKTHGDLAEVFAKTTDYTPEWDKQGSSDRAPVRFDVSFFDDVRFMSRF